MADDKTKIGGPDRDRVAGEQPDEVTYFAAKHGLTSEEALKIITEAGPGRASADELAERRKKG